MQKNTEANLSLDKRVWDHCEAQEKNVNILSVFALRNTQKVET